MDQLDWWQRIQTISKNRQNGFAFWFLNQECPLYLDSISLRVQKDETILQ